MSKYENIFRIEQVSYTLHCHHLCHCFAQNALSTRYITLLPFFIAQHLNAHAENNLENEIKELFDPLIYGRQSGLLTAIKICNYSLRYLSSRACALKCIEKWSLN